MGDAKGLFFDISLAQWSLHKMLFAKELDNLDFPAYAKNTFGISGVEFVNQFFKDKAEDQAYLNDLKGRCTDNGVSPVLIMVDGEGGLGITKASELTKAIENHHKWVEAAKFLGCHSIRVNAFGEGTREEVQLAAIEGLSRLGEFAKPMGMNIIVENHGGYSSDGSWLSGVMRQVGMDNVGTLPDFGNFCITRKKGDWETCLEEYDRYQGTTDLMPFAKGVSAKTHDFDEAGNETKSDYRRLLTIVKEAGYKGFIGIEYEGSRLSEVEGIKATKALLEKVGAELS
ncbi:MAG: sugar phosphate isomerase/epimerase [Bacteroidia bacterium]|nr:sugar phosphate isomerase/epimerase [Bacteroidia bacterium]